MKSLILATAVLSAAALAIPVLAPVSAYAQHQTTGTQTQFRQSVRAKQGRHYTGKRHQIIRAERSTPNSGFTEGSGGSMR